MLLVHSKGEHKELALCFKRPFCSQVEMAMVSHTQQCGCLKRGEYQDFISFQAKLGLLLPGGHLPLLSVSSPGSCYPKVEIHAWLWVWGGMEQRKKLNCCSSPQ